MSYQATSSILLQHGNLSSLYMSTIKRRRRVTLRKPFTSTISEWSTMEAPAVSPGCEPVGQFAYLGLRGQACGCCAQVEMQSAHNSSMIQPCIDTGVNETGANFYYVSEQKNSDKSTGAVETQQSNQSEFYSHSELDLSLQSFYTGSEAASITAFQSTLSSAVLDYRHIYPPPTPYSSPIPSLQTYWSPENLGSQLLPYNYGPKEYLIPFWENFPLYNMHIPDYPSNGMDGINVQDFANTQPVYCQASPPIQPERSPLIENLQTDPPFATLEESDMESVQGQSSIINPTSQYFWQSPASSPYGSESSVETAITDHSDIDNPFEKGGSTTGGKEAFSSGQQHCAKGTGLSNINGSYSFKSIERREHDGVEFEIAVARVRKLGDDLQAKAHNEIKRVHQGVFPPTRPRVSEGGSD
ncbi:hypothetical protein F5Y16DRAFT_31128 [Xylariaceae sp. FL0255]|nr:hypothetical protein F5Y16DRAFT_31128 [Xylariaceae sp. FL0255]